MRIDSGEIGRLIDQFESEDEKQCVRACEQLIEAGETAVPGLLQALHREDSRSRKWALVVLGNIGTAAVSAVPDLISILESPSSLSWSAAEALGRIGDSSAVPCLIEALSDENFLCVCAACALGKIGDLRAVRPLVDVLRDSQKFWVPRGAAAFALGELGERAHEALPALEEALGYDCEGAGEPWDERAQEAVIDAIDRVRGLSKETSLKGHGYRYEMWGIN